MKFLWSLFFLLLFEMFSFSQQTPTITADEKEIGPDYIIAFDNQKRKKPVCTTEFIAFQKNYVRFKEINCELIGLSMDQVFAHIKWEEWIREKIGVQIEFPIIADDGRVANILGMVHPRRGNNTVRAVFVVDNEGVVRIILYYPQELGRNVAEILRAVKAMQLSDQHGVAMPENWPDNELIKDSVIIPPPRDVFTAQERLKQAKEGKFECFDWWLCYKKIPHS